MFTGSLVALLTPFTQDGAIDFIALDKLVDFHLANQTDGIVVLGTTGESPTITDLEYPQIISRVVERVAKRIPVIAGIGKNATAATVKLAKQAADLNVDGLLIVTPYYNRPSQEGLYQHYMTIAEAVDLPQILYNVPGRTGCDLLPSTVARLMRIANIKGIKETVNVARVKELIESCGNIAIYCGDDANNLPMLEAGACGLISVTANIAPRALHDMCVAFYTGDFAQAQKIHAQLSLLNKNLFLEANPIPIKWAASQLGLTANVLRLPLVQLNEVYQADVRAAMQCAGIIEEKINEKV